MKQATRTVSAQENAAASVPQAVTVTHDFHAAPAAGQHARPTFQASDLTVQARPESQLTTPARSHATPAWYGIGDALSRALATEAEHGRAFLFLPVAMGTGSGLWFMAATEPQPLLLWAGLILAGLVAVWAGRARANVGWGASLVAAMFAGAVAAGIEARRGAVLLDSDVTTNIAGIVETREFDSAGRVRYLIRLSSTSDPQIRRPPERVRLVASTTHQPLPAGAVISGRARLSAPSGPVLPGGYDFAFRAFNDRIGAHGFFYRAPERGPPDVAAAADDPDWLKTAARWVRGIREHISDRFRAVLPGDPGGIAAALAVSDRSGISAETVEALRATGLAHILAISGLHMALAAGTLYVVIRKGLALAPGLAEALPVKKFAAVGALMTATAYLAISGGSVSTRRAWIMLAIMLVAVLADRPALTMRNVALAAMAIILLTPSAVVGPGFQMSFAATAALIAAYAAIARRDRTAPMGFQPPAPVRGGLFVAKAIVALAITSLVAGLATGLFSAHHFHRVAGNGVLANVAAMPLVTFVVMPSGLFALLLMPFGLDEWPLRLMGKGLEGVIWVANRVQDLGGDIVVGQIPLTTTVLAGTGLMLLVLLETRLRLAGVALICLGVALALPPLRPPPPKVLVSEAGDLVGLIGEGAIATNAARPSDFIAKQWQTALRAPVHISPEPYDRAGAEGPALLDQLLASATAEPSRFHCAGRGVCAAVHKAARIVAINEAALIGAACDRADLVVVAVPVYMKACRSGAALLSARSLRRSGSVAVRISGDETTAASIRPAFEIDTAIGGAVRPWTIQRYYDWRSGRYHLPN